MVYLSFKAVSLLYVVLIQLDLRSTLSLVLIWEPFKDSVN